MIRSVSVFQLLSIGLVLPFAVQGMGSPDSLSQDSPAARDVLLGEATSLPTKRESLVNGLHEIRDALSSAEDLETFIKRSAAHQEQRREPRRKKPSSGNNNSTNSTQDDESGADRSATITMHVSIAMSFALLLGFLQM
ncbi:hypothetical protein F5X99DRAFT_295798 [Biscogniauxia marginata]|nr:hypothetical protein F5X99DRAFT_295798 [Biscogniauxia marginata]